MCSTCTSLEISKRGGKWNITTEQPGTKMETEDAGRRTWAARHHVYFDLPESSWPNGGRGFRRMQFPWTRVPHRRIQFGPSWVGLKICSRLCSFRGCEASGNRRLPERLIPRDVLGSVN